MKLPIHEEAQEYLKSTYILAKKEKLQVTLVSDDGGRLVLCR